MSISSIKTSLETLPETTPVSIPVAPEEASAQPEPSIAPIVKALENIFHRLNERFFESVLSTPVITVSPDPRRKDRLGWCTTQRVWQDGQSDGYFEINVCAEYLNLSFENLCAVLLHEMCHLLNAEKEKKDTSRAGTYHNDIFRETAEGHGLIANKIQNYGYSDTRLALEAEEFIVTLDRTEFSLYRENKATDDITTDEAAVKPSSTRKYKCPDCKKSVRATTDVRIRCEDCDVLYEKQEKR